LTARIVQSENHDKETLPLELKEGIIEKYTYSPSIMFTTKYALHLLLVEHSKGLKSKNLQVV
jgi:hypothetical protein